MVKTKLSAISKKQWVTAEELEKFDLDNYTEDGSRISNQDVSEDDFLEFKSRILNLSDDFWKKFYRIWKYGLYATDDKGHFGWTKWRARHKDLDMVGAALKTYPENWFDKRDSQSAGMRAFMGLASYLVLTLSETGKRKMRWLSILESSSIAAEMARNADFEKEMDNLNLTLITSKLSAKNKSKMIERVKKLKSDFLSCEGYEIEKDESD
jgi:hypothetical protein